MLGFKVWFDNGGYSDGYDASSLEDAMGFCEYLLDGWKTGFFYDHDVQFDEEKNKYIMSEEVAEEWDRMIEECFVEIVEYVGNNPWEDCLDYKDETNKVYEQAGFFYSYDEESNIEISS